MGSRSAWGRRLSRRDALAATGLGLLALFRPRGIRGTARAEVIGAAAAPRYWVHIVATGGIDAVWTTDPRTRGEVAPGVDVPYGPGQIVHASGMRLGPHFAPLAPAAGRFSIVNGVLVRTANHYTGLEQSARLRTKTTMRTPAIFDIIGAHRDSQALAGLTLNATLRQAQTATFFGTSIRDDFGGGAGLLARLDSLQPDEKRELAEILNGRLRLLRRRGSVADDQALAIDNLAQVQAVLERTADLPSFESHPWLDGAFRGRDDVRGSAVYDLQRALWFIENDLTATVTIFAGDFIWDTHYDNDRLQNGMTPPFAAALARFLAELAARSNRHGTLADLTGVVVTSELGRFPYKNQLQGKDHFPQTFVLVSGARFVAGRQLGGNGRELEALSISSRTGQHAPGERLVLDDIGYNILKMANIRPEAYGVTARDLRFLEVGAT